MITWNKLKYFYLLFSFYFFVLTTMPCTDGIACNDESSKTSVIVDTTDHDDLETCSPFCVCACCSAQLNQPAYYSFYFKAVGYTNLEVLTMPQVAEIAIHNIWQPPRA